MSCQDNVHFNALVFVTAKVICLHDAKKVASGKRKQDAIIADSTAMAVLALWQDDIGTINLDRSYCFTNHLVSTPFKAKIVCVPKDAETALADDLIDVEQESSDSDTDPYTRHMDGVEIIGVSVFTSCTACITCKAKIKVKSEKIGYCTSVLCHKDWKCTCKKQLSAKIMYWQAKSRGVCRHLANKCGYCITLCKRYYYCFA